jgi:FkbM family methyltransferase
MKKTLKAGLVHVAKWLGPRLPSRGSRRWLCDRMVPYLMDPDVLPRGLVERPTRRFDVDVLCDPYVYVHRDGYWCGVFYEEELEAYLVRHVRPGDTVLDVGMNVGHVTLPAASLVGPKGKVIAFEPNLDLVRRVSESARRQRLEQVSIQPFGLGAVDGSFELRMEPAHAGGATFRNTAAGDAYSVTMTCAVKVGDQVLDGTELPGRVFLKMDVEGFELQALQGLVASLARVDHAVIEVSPEWLQAEGVARLFSIMADAGLTGHAMTDDGAVGKRLAPADVRAQANVVFVR